MIQSQLTQAIRGKQQCTVAVSLLLATALFCAIPRSTRAQTSIAGWTADQVRGAFGPPRRSETDNDGIETWYYGQQQPAGELSIFVVNSKVVGWKPLDYPLNTITRPSSASAIAIAPPEARSTGVTVAGLTEIELKNRFGAPSSANVTSDGITTWQYSTATGPLSVFVENGRVVGWKPLAFSFPNAPTKLALAESRKTEALTTVAARPAASKPAAVTKATDVHANTIDAATRKPFPDAFLRLIPGGERYRDANYFNLIAADGIHAIDPKIVYERMTAAAGAGELYKALYLARVFTDLQPQSAAGWSNRGKLAKSLVFQAEAAACEKIVASPSDGQVPLAPLPGETLTLKPTSLADWAASIALVADSATSKEGRAAFLSVKDDVSGVKVSTPQEVAAADQERQAENLPPRGPWAVPVPVRLEDIAPNLFVLRTAQPMNEKSTNKGTFLMGLVAASAAGLGSGAGATATQIQNAERLRQASEYMMADASAVASHYVGGEYQVATYANERPIVSSFKPKSAGEWEALDTPVPVLWAAGSATSASYLAQIRGSGKLSFRRVPNGAGVDLRRVKSEPGSLPPLYFPKVAQVWEGDDPQSANMTGPVTIGELLFTRDDIAKLSSVDNVPTIPGLDDLRSRYGRAVLRVSLHQQFNGWMIGFDSGGAAYAVTLSPTQWLVPVSVRK